MLAVEEKSTFFELERAIDRRKLQVPEQTLAPLTGLVVIDEIQRELAPLESLRVLLDRPGTATRFLLLGSASPMLVRGSAETLAGRVGLVDLSGFDLGEVRAQSSSPWSSDWRELWLRGGFPRSFLATDARASGLWRESFVRTFLERDMPQFGIRVPAATIRRFWTMVAHYHGQVWNAAEFARAIGTGQSTARRYLDILHDAQMVRILPPWHENLKKRQVKAPKIYVRDAGLLHSLLELETFESLSGHVKIGASFEGFGLEQVLACLMPRSAYFWSTYAGAELDLMITLGGRRHGFEFKYSDATGTTRSMRIALKDLSLERLWIIYPGTDRYELDARITVWPVSRLPELWNELAVRPSPGVGLGPRPASAGS